MLQVLPEPGVEPGRGLMVPREEGVERATARVSGAGAFLVLGLGVLVAAGLYGYRRRRRMAGGSEETIN